MAVTDTDTNLEICTAALRKIGVVGMGVTASADEIETARTALSRMLKSWQSKGYNLWAVTSMSVTATTSASYSLTPERPLSLSSVRWKATTETPMQELSRDEYDRLPLKTSTGTPTSYYYNRQREDALLYVWPVPASVTTQTLEITYIRELADVAQADEADIPGEWYDCVVYGLAARLADDFMVSAPGVIARAEMLLDEALAGDREGSIYFVGDMYR